MPDVRTTTAKVVGETARKICNVSSKLKWTTSLGSGMWMYRKAYRGGGWQRNE